MYTLNKVKGMIFEMNHIITYIKKNKNDLIIIFLLLLAFIGIFSLNRSAPDTYSLEAYKYMNFGNSLPYFKDGRFFMTAFVLILSKLKVSYVIFKLISWMLAFISLYFGIVIFNNMLKLVTKKSHILLSFLTIVNIFVLEFLIFADYSGVMCLGILSTVLSANFFLKFLVTAEKKNILLSILLSLCTTFCYQGVICLVVILSIIFTLKYSKKFGDFVKNNLLLVLIYAVPTLSAFVLGKLLGTYRLTGSSVSIFKRLESIFSQTVELLINTGFILPKYLFLIICFIGVIIFMITSLKKQDKWKKNLFLVYCMAACLIVPLAPQFIVDYNNIWLTPRSCVGLGILCLIPYLLDIIYNNNSNKNLTIITCLLVLLSAFEFRGYLVMGYNQIKNNTKEEFEAGEILGYIYNYELKHQELKNIVIYPDKNISYTYPGIKAYKDINTRVGSRDWGTRAILFRTLNRKLDVKKDKDFEEYCKSNDWNSYVDETIKIDNDTLYICIY